jgi:transcriptional regulator with XRE-family HTH domain
MKRSQAGVRLRQWLQDERRTQEWLAEQLGTFQPNVSRWIRGGPPPSIETAKAIRRITGISIEAWTEPAPQPVSSTNVAADLEHRSAS